MKKNPAAVALGRRGGQATSAAKTAAVRLNGAKGGRPLRVLKIDLVAAARVLEVLKTLDGDTLYLAVHDRAFLTRLATTIAQARSDPRSA